MYYCKSIGLRVGGVVSFWLLSGVLFMPLCAQHPMLNESLDTNKVYEIKGAVVSAQRYNEVIPSQKLRGEDLQRLNSHSVADAIRYFSGIQIKDYGGIGGLKTVDIRSMGTNHMGVFYDGIQLGNAQNGQIDLGKFSLDNIEEVSLYNGQKSEIFQPAKDFGAAGTIYLRTRRPKFEKNKNYNLKAVLRTGSFGLANPSILWEQKITNALSSSFNAEYTYSTGEYKFRYRKVLPDGSTAWDTTAIRQNGDIQAFRMEGGFHGYFKKSIWNAKAYFYDSEKGIPGAIVNNLWKRSQRQWDKNFFTQASLTSEIHPRYSFMANVKYANDYMRYLNPDTTLIYIDNHFVQQEVYASLANKFAILNTWDISFSTDFQWNTLDASLQNFSHPQRLTTLTAIATAIEIWHFKMQASLLGTFINEKADSKGLPNFLPEDQPASAPNKQEYTPAVFFSYKPFEKTDFNIRAFYKRIFRMPTFNDLYYTDIGNISLRPEYTTQYNWGMQYTKIFGESSLEALTLKADAYYNEVTDKIVAVPKGNGQYRWMMMNIGYVEIRGIDANAQFTWGFLNDIRLQTSLNYTFQKAQDFTDPSDNDPIAGTWGGQIAYIPWHNGSFTVRADYKTWEFNYSFVYVGERYHNSSNIRENHEEPWYTSDLSFGKEFRLKKMNFKASAEINNIFNQQYDVVLNYPMPGTNFKIILNFEI